MKGHLESTTVESPEAELQIEEVWSEEKLRKRSEELQLIDTRGSSIVSL